MAISCQAFSDFLSRRSEHLDEQIIHDLHPASTLIGMVETGRFPAQDGVSHTFDRFNNVFPDLSHAWEDVTAGSCIGTPCDPTEREIGMGYTRDMYKLQRAAYKTPLFCYDEILSADRAKQQFAHVVKTLRRATELIISDRLQTEMFRIAGYHWLCGLGGLTAFTFTETGNLINLTIPQLANLDSKLVVNHLRQRLETQLLNGAVGEGNIQEGQPPELEVVSDFNTIWDCVQGDHETMDHWRFDSIDRGSELFKKYGWTAHVGNFMLHAHLHPLRFQIRTTLAGLILSRVFPYINIAATQGIKEVVNPAYVNAPVECTFIWHRKGMRSLGRDSTSIHPMMPFAMQDYGGKWQFCMDNLTCGSAIAKDPVTGADIEIPIAVDNSYRNKGIFKARFEFATQAQYPEFVEAFLHLREPPCVTGEGPCADTPAYVFQNFDSGNEGCE